MVRRLAIRRPKLVLGFWGAVVVVLAVLGMGVENRLHRTDIALDHMPSGEAAEVARKHFGDSANLIVLVEGPRAQTDAQSRRLARRLDSIADISVLGPWAPGAARTLRPRGNRVALLVRAERPFSDVSERLVPRIRREVRRTIRAPAKGFVTGYADVASGVHTNSVEALERAELIAAPVLLLVLLLVFRSPIAAAIPLAAGFATIGACRGLLDLVNRFTDLDVVSLNMASMMGLALGVDYSLVLVSRFREEVAAGRPVTEAAGMTATTAGRTVVFAGLALAVSAATSVAVAPGALLKSAGTGVMAAVVLSVLAGVTALPAILVLLGRHIDRWRFGRVDEGQSRWGALALRALKRPALAASVVLLLVLALSAPALALSIGSPDPRNLPESARERTDFDHIFKVFGGGWSAPYEIVVARDRGPLTDRRRLQAIDRWQDGLLRDPDVLAVLGPGAIAERTKRFAEVERGLAAMGSELRRAQRDQGRLASGLEQAQTGVGRLGEGLDLAAAGAGELGQGAGRGAEGAGRLRRGLSLARAGAKSLRAGVRQAGDGASSLQRGNTRLATGARELAQGLATARRSSEGSRPRVAELRAGLEQGAKGLEQLREPARSAESQLKEALSGLDAMLPTSKADPAYERVYRAVATASGAVSGRNPLTGQPVAAGYDGLDAELATASAELGRAAAGVRRLEAGTAELLGGLGRLERGAARLRRGIDELASGTDRLDTGLGRLGGGSGALARGLERLRAGGGELARGGRRLHAGAGELETGLRTGAQRTTELEQGLARMHAGVVMGRSRSAQLGRRLSGGPGGGIQTELFRSGYLTLAALDKAGPAARNAATFAVNLDRGGSATRVVVIEKGNPSRAGNKLRDRLEEKADRLGERTGTDVKVGGPAATLQDFDEGTTSRLPALIVALALATYVVLVPLLRSLLLPLIAVLLNVLTVVAAFGVLVIGFQGDAPLGGVGHLDAIMVMAIYSIVFGLSIDYEVFLLTRMQEGYERTRSTSGAIDYGLTTTAGVITGAALIMTAVFVAFASAEVVSMRQLGVGLTVAVVLDATIVRLVLLPALIRVSGRAAWWLPGPLDRVLPRVPVEPAVR